MKSHDNISSGEDIAGEELTYVAVEGSHFPAIQCYRTTVGPIDSPQARLRIEQPQGEGFKGFTVKFGGENIEIAETLQDRVKMLSRLKFIPLVTAC